MTADETPKETAGSASSEGRVTGRDARTFPRPPAPMSTELHALSFEDAEAYGRAVRSLDETVTSFLDLFLWPDSFKSVAVLRAFTGRVRTYDDIRSARTHRATLRRKIIAGFEAVFVMRHAGPEIRHFLDSLGYATFASSPLGSGAPGDLLDDLATTCELHPVIATLDLGPGETACVFAHDADPVYVLERPPV